MPAYRYFQVTGGEETWQAVPEGMCDQLIADKHPMFVTVLAVDRLVDTVPAEDHDKLKYLGNLYLDWDSADIEHVIEKTQALLISLQLKGLDLTMAKLFATGGKGFHAEIPMECFMAKVPKQGITMLPVIYKQMAFDMAVDTLDLRVYSARRGRMWRQPNVKRPNGKYKVQITPEELAAMTPSLYEELTSRPRTPFPTTTPKQVIELTLAFDAAYQAVQAKLAKRKKKNGDAGILKGCKLPSLEALMQGRGVKADTGFHQLSMQLAIVAEQMGWDEDKLASECQGLIEAHAGDGSRYNTPAKRREEIVRMHRYMNDNPCYEFSIGAIKTLLSHEAPDLDGIPVSKEEVEEAIVVAESAPPEDSAGISAKAAELMDEYSDVAGGVDMNKWGVYIDTDNGKKRVCAVSFDKVSILRDVTSGQVSCYDAEVLVNGKSAGRQTLELDIFAGLQSFNRFCSRLAHAMQGSDQHVRGLMMRVAEKAVKGGKVVYVAKREGLDLVNIPGHENEALRTPFMIWADSKGVVMEPWARETGVQMSFQGYPDSRGVYRTDLSDAPRLAEWIKEPENKQRMKDMLHNFFSCQRPDVIGNLLGWYTSTFYRMLFNRVYDKFPALHVNGAAGSGKSEMNRSLLNLFYYSQQPTELTPESTLFAIQQNMSSSASIPLMIDEYKPHEMHGELHNKLKLLFRDAYNNREVQRGGGNRDSDDYRSLHKTQLAAPVLFIGEVMEEEPAVMERVVLVTIVKPPTAASLRWSARFNAFKRDKQLLGILGHYMSGSIVNGYSVEKLRTEFDPMYAEAKDKYMLNERDIEGNLDAATLREKQGAKERTVFNFTVAKFGLQKFRSLLDEMFGQDEFREAFDGMEAAVYNRMKDLLPATQAEYLKVVNTLAHMSYLEVDKPEALVQKRDYAFLNFGGKDAIEFSMRQSYHRYRVYQRSVGYKPLFSGDQAFLHAMKDSSALLVQGPGKELQVAGGTYIFDLTELKKLGVDDFKS